MSVAQVRLLVGDLAQAARFETEGDGATQDFLLPEHPILAGTFTLSVDGRRLTETVDYTLTAKAGVVHLVTPPGFEKPLAATYQWAQFDDEDLGTLLSLEGDNPRLAAADALDAIASNTAMLQGRMTMLDLSLDGAAVATSLRAHADALRAQSTAAPPPEDEAGFDIAEMAFSSNWHEKLAAESMRGLV